MEKVRIGLDVNMTFEVNRLTGQEDLSNCDNMRVVLAHTSYSNVFLINTFEIEDNLLKIHVKGGDMSRDGVYRIVVSYTKYNPDRDPHAEPFVVDSLAFEIVRLSNKVVDSDPNVSQIVLAGIVHKCKDGNDGDTPVIGENLNWWIRGVDTELPSRGEKFYFSDYTEEDIVILQKPALDAAKTVLETNDNIIKSEKTRVDNFNKIVSDSAIINKTLTDTNTDITKEELLRVESEKKRELETDQAIANTNHTPYIENGTWWKFDIEQQKYINTGDVATVQFAAAEVDPVTGLLSFRYPEGFDELNFSINNGKLIITI